MLFLHICILTFIYTFYLNLIKCSRYYIPCNKINTMIIYFRCINIISI